MPGMTLDSLWMSGLKGSYWRNRLRQVHLSFSVFQVGVIIELSFLAGAFLLYVISLACWVHHQIRRVIQRCPQYQQLSRSSYSFIINLLLCDIVESLNI